MRKADLPFLADWFAVSLRWLTLLGLAISMAGGGHLRIEIAIGFLVYAGWNMFSSVLAITNRRMPAHRYLNVLIDFTASLAFFWLSDGGLSPIAWTGLLALFSAGIYFELLGGLVVGVLLSAAQSALIYYSIPAPMLIPPLAVAVGTNMGFGILLGVMGHRIMSDVRGNFRSQMEARKAAEDRAQKVEHDRMQAFYSMALTLGATLSYQTVLDKSLDLGAQVVADNPESAERIVSAVLLFDNDQLKFGSARHLGAVDLRQTLPGMSGILAQAVKSADPIVGEEPGKDPELAMVMGLQSCRSVVALALRTGLNVYGVLLFAHPDVNYFTAERCEVLEVIKTQAVIALQNALLYRDLEQDKVRLSETLEEARRKLARDLHDGPTQSVAAIAMRVNFTRRLIEKDVHAATEELVKIEELARRTTKEIRHMLFTLRPLVLESQGLVAAFESMADKMRETYGQDVIVEVSPELLEAIEIGKQTVIFYIAEEAANNARKHAEAAHIWVRLRPLAGVPEIAVLDIQDNGKGFDVKEVNSNYENRGSLGMVNLRERSELINGLLDIQSMPDKGTRVRVYIPLSEEAADRLHRSRQSVN